MTEQARLGQRTGEAPRRPVACDAQRRRPTEGPTDLHRAFVAFLGGLGLPVYRSGQVPDGAAFPYLTYSLPVAGLFRSAAAEATGWFRGGDRNAACAAFLDRAAALLPEGGTLLRAPGGVLTLYRGDPFARQVIDGDALGGRVTLDARCYIASEVRP